MGADTFTNIQSGASAKEAFDAVVREAQYEHGHGGYTGTIAEKSDFIMVKASADLIERIKAGKYFDCQEHREHWDKVDDKWGPAGCIDLQDGRYLFFGWASS